jgi:CRISPR/Cas system-associated exonuclease Cas4 (RecB family)
MKTDAGESLGGDDLYGIADAVIWHGNHLSVIDLKYGRWPVSPVANKQLQIYAVGVAAQAAQIVETITLGIIQPRTEGPPLKLHTLDRQALDRFAVELESAAAATDSPAAPHTPGDHCTFCRVRDVCPQRQGKGN